MSLTIKICKNTIILSNKAFSSLKETYLSFRDYLNLRHRCPLQEIGDVENWAKSIETDMRTISSALEYAYNKRKHSLTILKCIYFHFNP